MPLLDEAWDKNGGLAILLAYWWLATGQRRLWTAVQLQMTAPREAAAHCPD